MTSMEKYQKMLSLTPYADRSEIPIFPMYLASFGSLGGVLQKDIVESCDKWLEAIDNTIARYGKPDVCMPIYPGDTIFTMGLKSRLPGRELPEDELYQFVETPYFEDQDEYKKIYDMGFMNWKFMYLCDIQNPKMTPEQLGARYAELGMNTGKAIQFIYSRGMVPAFDYGTAPIFDDLSMIRSMQEFTFDFNDDPDMIMDIIRRDQPLRDDDDIKQVKQNGGWRINMFAMRSSSTFISPSIFEEYVWPIMKASVEKFHEAGILAILHADGNWLPMMEYFKEAPKGSMHIELDGSTDIFKSYEILDGWQSIRGDVPATMMAYGTPDEVSEYCEKLIQMGMKGGFMLSSGCEIPLNAKPENIDAFMNSLR